MVGAFRRFASDDRTLNPMISKRQNFTTLCSVQSEQCDYFSKSPDAKSDVLFFAVGNSTCHCDDLRLSENSDF